MSDVAEFERVHAVPAANGSTLSWDAGTCSRADVPQHEFVVFSCSGRSHEKSTRLALNVVTSLARLSSALHDYHETVE